MPDIKKITDKKGIQIYPETSVDAVINLSECIPSNLSDLNNDVNFVSKNDLEEKLENIKIRKFNPKFGINAYWGEVTDLSGSIWNADIEKIENDLLDWESHKCDEVIIPIHISYNINTEQLFIIEDLDAISHAITYCENLNIKIKTVKIHIQKITENIIIENIGMDKFKSSYLQLIGEIADFFKGSTVEIITVLNETGFLYESNDHLDFCINCIDTVQNKGFISGITIAGFTNAYKVLADVIEKSDKIFINAYPIISIKKEKTSLEDGLNAWKSANVDQHIRKLRELYNKDIIISESGVQDYWVSLINPSNWDWSSSNLVESNGKAPYIYLYGLFETLMYEEIEAVWWWYDLNYDLTKNLSIKYLEG